ncbi:glycosyltransferase [Demequina maris]|uniref:glycosyltransferase n=1 Tax=Demequina maris TaxID=1638982 RepID=UPI00078215DE|nr:glycosyltransferase [Demequina maris]
MGKSVAIIGTRGYPSYYGGFETAVRKVAPYLAARGWDVTVYGRRGAARIDDPDRDHSVHTSVTWGLESKSLSTLSYGLSASAVAAIRRHDVALVMNVANGFFLPFLRARGVKTVVNVDGIEWERAKWGRTASNVFLAGARATAKYADSIVCDSVRIQSRWRGEFDVDGVFIPYGADSVEDPPVPLGLERRGYVLLVARFVPENTVEEFIAAVDALPITTTVVIVGSAGYPSPIEDAVARLAERRQHVQWLGHVSDDALLAALWYHAGAYFHGHSVGGTNPALVQAMAAGAPVVARDTEFNREVLADTAAAFVEPTSEAIAEGISRVLRSPALQESASMRARSRAAEHYTWDGICALYERALVDALNEGSKRRLI